MNDPDLPLTDSSETEDELEEPTEADLAEALTPEGAEKSAEETSEPPRDSGTALAPVSSLQLYLTEIRKYPYLSKEEELELFHQYRVLGSRDAAAVALQLVAVAGADQHA